MHKEPPTAEHYREAAEEIRAAARRVKSEEIRNELFDLAERYDRLTRRAGRRQLYNSDLIVTS